MWPKFPQQFVHQIIHYKSPKFSQQYLVSLLLGQNTDLQTVLKYENIDIDAVSHFQ